MLGVEKCSWQLRVPSIDTEMTMLNKQTTPKNACQHILKEKIEEKYCKCKKIFTDESKMEVRVGTAA